MSRTAQVALALVLGTAAAAAQAPPPIGIVDFYGRRTVPEQGLLQALALHPGDAMPPRGEWDRIAQRVEGVAGVVAARLAPVCCADGRTILFVGIVERGATPLDFRSPPQERIPVPDDVRRTGDAFERAFLAAVEARDFAEDDTAGHALMHFPAARAAQLQFVAVADAHLDTLRAVLRRSGNPRDRALAAQVLPYTRDKAGIVPDLVRAMSDDDEEVRNNAMRALGVLGIYARTHPSAGVHVPTAPFVALLESRVWTDRNKASFALAQLTESPDPGVVDALRQHLPALEEMAHWRSRSHAFASYLILGHMGGMSDSTAHAAWLRDDADAMIAAARGKPVP